MNTPLNNYVIALPGTRDNNERDYRVDERTLLNKETIFMVQDSLNAETDEDWEDVRSWSTREKAQQYINKRMGAQQEKFTEAYSAFVMENGIAKLKYF